MDKVVPISIAKRTNAPAANTAEGIGVTLEDAESMLALHLGFRSDLMVSDTAFSISLTYQDGRLPETKFGLFIVVNDKGYPFLLGGSMTSWGMDVRYNSYINPLLESDLRNIQEVDVIEVGSDSQRCYKVPLRHCFE